LDLQFCFLQVQVSENFTTDVVIETAGLQKNLAPVVVATTVGQQSASSMKTIDYCITNHRHPLLLEAAVGDMGGHGRTDMDDD